MPINPSIPLAVQVPQAPDPLESYGKVLSLKALAQQGQMGAERLRAAQIANQEHELEAQEQSVIQQAYGEVGGDIAKLPKALAGRVRPDSIFKLQKSINDAIKAEADKDETQWKFDSQKRSLLRGIYKEAANAMTPGTTPEQRQRIYSDAVARARSMGLLSKDANVPDAYPGDEEFGRMGMFLATDAAVEAEAERARKARLEEAQEGRAVATHGVTMDKNRLDLATQRRRDAVARLGAATTPDQYNQILGAMSYADVTAMGLPAADKLWDAQGKPIPGGREALLAAGMTPDQQAADARARRPVPGRDVPLPPGVEAQRARIAGAGAGGVALPPAASVGFTGERNEEWLKQVEQQDQGFANRVRAVVDGRYPIPTGAALRNPQTERLLNAAATYEPGFDLTQWKVRTDTRTEFARGNAARNIRSLNTLIDHAGKLMDVTDRLGNWGFVPANRVVNTARANTFGSPALRDWNLASQAVISEAVTLFKGTGATNQEIDEMRQHFLPHGTMEEQKSGIKTIIGLAFGRLQALDDQFRNAFKRPRDFQFLSPKSLEILKDKIGVSPDAVDPKPETGEAAPAPGGPPSDPMGVRQFAAPPPPVNTNKPIDLSRFWTK